MKDFVKIMLAVICAYIVIRIISFILILSMFAGAIAGGSGAPIPKEGVLDLNMSEFVLAEQSQEMSMPNFGMGGMTMPEAQVGLLDAVSAIEAAAADPGVKYILLRPENAGMGMAHAEEFRAALQEFRRSGKPVIAWLESPANLSYYMATVADKIYMSSYHGFNYQLLGISTQLMYVKDILDKLGVNVQLIRHGKYKSAGEMYIRSNASEANREQYQLLINSAWAVYRGAIAASRDLDPDQLDAWIDNLAFNLPEDFLEKGLVDELVDHEALLGKLCTLAQVENADQLKLIPFADYLEARVPMQLSARNQVAVLYADGEIIDGDEYTEVAGDRFVKEIDKLRKDAHVKAVVLRVNSPGGSVSASEKIRTALDLLQKEKPLVASYANYAASGGYWISNGCQKIYSDAATITGSIGVFSMIPEFSQVTRKVGVGVEAISSHKHSDVFSLMRPFDKAEMDYMQASVEDIYERFVQLVADSRGKAPEEVDALAQGRVWAGTDALECGLVDEIGTLEDAISYAAALAGFHASDEYAAIGYPKPLSTWETIMQQIGSMREEPSILSGTPFEGLGWQLKTLKKGQPGVVYARLPYALEIR